MSERIGRYRVLSRIAAGGMGEVYRADMQTADGFGRPVALKLVRADIADAAAFDELFVQEAHVAMSLSHANVVQAFDVGKLDDRWFLAMEYVDGTNLALLLRECATQLEQPLPHRHVLLVAVEALKGLDYAHRRKDAHGTPLSIVHRDISPGNLLISFEGEVKIADFGIATSTRLDPAKRESVKGKLPYIAPEQLRGSRVDLRADLYSMGAVLYEMLTTQRIVSAMAGVEAIPDILNGRFPRPREIRSDIPPELERITLRALELEPTDRYASAAAMRQELEALAMKHGYLLSSADLAEFTRELFAPCSAMPPAHGESAIRHERTGSPAGTGVAAKPTPAELPFDALLGAELERVRSTQTFNIFTAHHNLPRSADPEDRSPLETGSEGISRPPITHVSTIPGVRRPPRLWRRAAIAAAAGSIVVTAAYFGVVGLDGEDPPQPILVADDAGTPVIVASPPIVDASVEFDAGIPRVNDAGAPVDAGFQEDARVAPVARGTAYLSIIVTPWAYISINGRRVGENVVRNHAVPAGRVTITVHNPVLQVERRQSLELRDGQHRDVSINLLEEAQGDRTKRPIRRRRIP